MMRMKSLVFFLIVSFPVFAVDVSYEGYFRSRLQSFYNLDLDRDLKPQTRNFTDLRFRLNPTFFITDKIRIRSSLNFFDGQLGNNPFRYGAHQNPSETYHRVLDISERESQIGRNDQSAAQLTSNGGIYLPDGFVESTDLQALQLRRVWGEFDIPFGTLLIGRMPFHLGLGIYANSGDDWTQEVGSTRDRIVFDTNFGYYYVRPGIGWLIEGALDGGHDDFMEYFFVFGRKSENQDLSMSLAYQSQDEYVNASTTSDLVGRGSGYWIFDFYAQNRFDWIELGAELALFTGSAMGRDLLAVNSAVQTTFHLDPTKILFEMGIASGTSQSEIQKGDIKSVAFNRDYNVALILFEEALPGGRFTKSSSGALTNSPTAPHAGAISNAIYPRLRFDFDVTSYFKPAINLVSAYAMTGAPGAQGKFYGIEYDLITNWPITSYLTAELSFGHLIPGSFYDHVSKSHSAVLARGGIIAHF